MKQLQPNQTNARSDILQDQSFCWRAVSLVAVALLCLSSSALAQSINYNLLDNSTLTLSGNALGGAYSGQGGNPLALVDNWAGYLLLTQTSPGNYTFGGGAVTAELNPLTPFLPAAGGSPAVLGGVDNYGCVTVSPLVGTLYTAYRDMTMSITGGNVVQGGSTPVTGTTLAFTAAHLDFDAPGVSGYRGTVGLNSWNSPSGANTSFGNISLSADGSLLTVPVTFTTTSFSAGPSPYNVVETWTGTLYAEIPEPSSLALVGLGLAAFAVCSIRRRERRS